MHITLAIKTLQAFDYALTHDGGNTYRRFLRDCMAALDDAYRDKEEGFRTHLGASLIGRECDREVWYGFHWVHKTDHSGQMLRLFNRGHLEEGRVIALLKACGVQTYQYDSNGKQFRISEFGGHFGGSGDGVGGSIPDLNPAEYALLEVKTHNDKSFTKLAGSNWRKFYEKLVGGVYDQNLFDGAGVREAKYEHWVQMQVYMHKMGLPIALYLAVNKNDDFVYAELVHLDSAYANKYIERAGTLIFKPSAPDRINKAQNSPKCTWCDYKPVCKPTPTEWAKPARNCRTCRFSEAKPNGAFSCENEDRKRAMVFGPSPGISEAGETFTLTKERQRIGCDKYEVNPTI